MTKYNKEDVAESKEYFAKILPNITKKETFNNDTKVYEFIPVIYTVVTKVASSKMSRWIKCFVSSKDGIEDVSRFVAYLSGRKYEFEKGVFISGCGMDMGFALVYDLSYKLDDILLTGKTGYKLHQEWL